MQRKSYDIQFKVETAKMKTFVAIAVLLTVAIAGSRLYVALRLATDEPDDGRLYARIALNVLDHHGYTIETEEPYSPTYIRLPGYPLFLAGVYSLFGRDNNRAVRVIQAAIDTLTCWLIGLLALVWSPGSWPADKRRRTLLIGLALAGLCPFPAIYVGTILTETWTTFLATGCVLAGSIAMKTTRRSRALSLWLLAGLLGGAATMLRPDSGLFVAAVGGTLAIVSLSSVFRRRSDLSIPTVAEPARAVLARSFIAAAIFALGFIAALTPWTIRNARVFGVFQPIAPKYANMPGEFSPIGYADWLRTWVTDVKYTEAFEWAIDEKPMHPEKLPPEAFDSDEERDRIAALYERYNTVHAEAVQQPAPPPPKPPEPAPDQVEEHEQNELGDAVDTEPPDEPETPDDEAAEPDTEDEASAAVEMTPEIDAGFAEIARERIARHPLRYYVIVPLKRAASMWFDTHSQYYPFQGELLPLANLDRDLHQQYWLPLFAAVTFLYTLLGLAGTLVMWRGGDSRKWILMFALLMLPRLGFLSSMENPEPRYVVELFAFVAATGALAVSALIDVVLKKARQPKIPAGESALNRS
jgi:hypothetical protein